MNKPESFNPQQNVGSQMEVGPVHQSFREPTSTETFILKYLYPTRSLDQGIPVVDNTVTLSERYIHKSWRGIDGEQPLYFDFRKPTSTEAFALRLTDDGWRPAHGIPVPVYLNDLRITPKKPKR